MNMHNPVHPDALRRHGAEVGSVRRHRRWLILAVVLLAALGAFVLVRGGKSTAPVVPVEQAPRVTVFVPGRTEVANVVRATGSIAARRDMPVGVQGEGGMITAVLAEAGDYVRAGAVLARVDRAVQTQQLAQMQAQVAQARADARLAQAELDRAQALVDRGFVSRADIDRRIASRDAADARANAAAAQVREMQARLGRLDIRAPAAGLVLARAAEPGQVVGPASQPLFRIAQNGAMEMQALVAEQDMARLRVGMPARVTLVGDTRAIDGQIWLLEPVIDARTRQGVARIALLRDPAIRVGAFANAEIEAGRALRPVLPQSAVQSDERGSYVYVVAGGNRVERRDIRTGAVSENGIAVVSGLTGGERVVLSAAAFLNPGEKIEPVLQSAR